MRPIRLMVVVYVLFCETYKRFSCNPKEQTTVQKLTNRQTTKKPTRKMAHLVLPDTQAEPSQNQKSHFFANALTPFRHKNLS